MAIFKRKYYSLEIQYKRNDKFVTYTLSNYKKIKYSFNKKTGILKATIKGSTGKKKIEYTNVISVELTKKK